VVFSRFTKKDDEPSKPAKPAAAKPAKPAGTARPAVPPAASKVTVEKIDQIEAEMAELDFTRSVGAAPPKAKAAAPATPAAQADAAPGKLRIERGFNPGGSKAAPAAPARPASPAAAKPAAPAAAKSASPAPPAPAPAQGVASVMMMEVQQSPFEAAPVLEEAAILYANHQDDAALAALEDAVKGGALPAVAARQAALMLFDMYENLGKRESFEEAAVDFAVRFETSPPAFNDRSVVKDPSLMTGGGQYFSFTGHIDNNAGRQFEQLKKIAAKDTVLRIEFSKIDTIAAEGAEMLLAFLANCRKSGHDLIFSSADHLMKLLAGMIETGRKDDPEVLWLLLLELYQLQYMNSAFEEAALNYCITYEVSPPSWIEPKKAPANTPPPLPTILEIPQDAFYLKGEIEGGADELFKAASAYAAERTVVVIDVFDVKRLDFIAGGSFLNLVTSLRGLDKKVEIRNPSPMIGALLAIMGFTAHAKITRRGK
jgi:anti-anti-sigma regulatory factor